MLERLLATATHIYASAIIADEDGIHWRTVRQAAELVKYVSEHSPESEGTFNFAVTAVCGTGLDTIPLPGDITIEQIERIFEDVASLATKWNKPLSARLQPLRGKKPGDETDLQSQFLFNTTLHPAP